MIWHNDNVEIPNYNNCKNIIKLINVSLQGEGNEGVVLEGTMGLWSVNALGL